MKKPIKNKSAFEGFIPTLTIHKYITIEIKFGVDVSKNEKKLKDV